MAARSVERIEASPGVLALLKRTRTNRGMPLVVDDPNVIARVAAIVATGGGGARDAA